MEPREQRKLILSMSCYILFIAKFKPCKAITMVHDVGYLRKRKKREGTV